LYRRQRYPLEEKWRKKRMWKRTTMMMRRGKRWRLLNRMRRKRGGDFDRQNIYHAGRDSSVGVATRYGIDSPGVESRGGARFSAPVQTGPGAHPTSFTMGTGSVPPRVQKD
jgi:hypothetical protein